MLQEKKYPPIYLLSMLWNLSVRARYSGKHLFGFSSKIKKKSQQRVTSEQQVLTTMTSVKTRRTNRIPCGLPHANSSTQINVNEKRCFIFIIFFSCLFSWFFWVVHKSKYTKQKIIQWMDAIPLTSQATEFHSFSLFRMHEKQV